MARIEEITAPNSALDNPSEGPPTKAIGNVTMTGVVPWANLGYIDQQEHVPDLIWPNSTRTYNIMRRDAQVHGLYQGCTLPIRRYRYVVDPNGTPATVYKKLAADMNLPIKGQDDAPRGRSRGRFQWGNFLRHALLGTIYGHMFFEIVGQYQSGDSLWHLTKLEERMPHTLTEIDVNGDGSLKHIKQAVGLQAPVIEADRLVPFVWEREGGNWLGNSMIRQMYKLWLVKDRVIRINAMSLERNGVGVPIIKAPPNATRGQMIALNQMAQAFKAGESSGGSIPNGAELTLEGVRGNIPDALKTWQQCNEEMSRSLLMMFMELGQGVTRVGSRSLGSEFIDYFQLAQENIAIWICETIAEELIEKWMWWNYGEKYETSPLIDFERNEEPDLAVDDLVMLIKSGAIHMDPELEELLRDRYMFPPLPDEFIPVYFPKNLPEEPSEAPPKQNEEEGEQSQVPGEQALEDKERAKVNPEPKAAARLASAASTSHGMLPSRRPNRRIWQ
jgi:hypothetical protein